MQGILLPLTDDPWQVMTVDVAPDGEPFHAQVELRYLPAPDQWVISIWDHAAGELLVNMIPLICSRAGLNDLLTPFRYLRNGKGLGSLFCLKDNDNTSSADPTEKDLKDFQVLWCDSV